MSSKQINNPLSKELRERISGLQEYAEQLSRFEFATNGPEIKGAAEVLALLGEDVWTESKVKRMKSELRRVEEWEGLPPTLAEGRADGEKISRALQNAAEILGDSRGKKTTVRGRA